MEGPRKDRMTKRLRVPVAAGGDGYLALHRTVWRVAFRRRRSSTGRRVAAEVRRGKLLKPHRNTAWLQSELAEKQLKTFLNTPSFQRSYVF